MALRRTAVLVSVALLFAGIETSIGNAQQTPAPVKAVQLTSQRRQTESQRHTAG